LRAHRAEAVSDGRCGGHVALRAALVGDVVDRGEELWTSGELDEPSRRLGSPNPSVG
jgi:hypothetical protein